MACVGRIILAIIVAMATRSMCVADDAPPVAAADGPQVQRPTMRQMAPSAGNGRPPSSTDLARARSELKRRFHEPLSHAETATGASVAAETLLTASTAEDDRALRWVMLEEARRLGEAAGQAPLISRAIAVAASQFDIDSIELELRCLKQIPLRGLDSGRAASLATAAENIATRAEADRRPDKAVAAMLLAYRAWQRAGNKEAARTAAARHDALMGVR